MSSAVVFNLTLKRQEKKLSEMRAWSENPINYRNTIKRAVSKLREIEGAEEVDKFLIDNLSVIRTVR